MISEIIREGSNAIATLGILKPNQLIVFHIHACLVLNDPLMGLLASDITWFYNCRRTYLLK